MSEIQYDRAAAVAYAEKWALGRNPAYYNFDDLGGDCTNFISQCLYAGSGVMNFTPVMGWYYIDLSDRTPSWSGVPYLYDFLIANQGPGPYAELIEKEQLQLGDVIQFGNAYGEYYHSVIVVDTEGGIFVAAHTYDVRHRNLESYVANRVRYLHIAGVREQD
jgi:hypothetical protein